MYDMPDGFTPYQQDPDDGDLRTDLKKVINQQAKRGPPSRYSNDPLTQLLQGLPPDQLTKITGASTIDPSDVMLQQQLARAHSLRMQRAGQPAYGAAAGMAAGLGGALSGVQEGILERRQQANIDKRQAALEAILQALKGGQNKLLPDGRDPSGGQESSIFGGG